MLGEKIRNFFRSGGGAHNGSPVFATDLGPRLRLSRAPAAAETERRSNGLRQFFENLPREGRLRILDLGGASQANVNFIALQGHKLYTEDLLVALERLNDKAKNSEDRTDRAARFVQESLNFPNEEFDGILVWDSLEFLDDELLWAAVGRMQAVLKPGGTLLTFFHTRAQGETVHVYRYNISDFQTLQLRPRFSRPLPRAFNNRNLERLFGNFHAVKFFLAKDNLREVIVTR